MELLGLRGTRENPWFVEVPIPWLRGCLVHPEAPGLVLEWGFQEDGKEWAYHWPTMCSVCRVWLEE